MRWQRVPAKIPKVICFCWPQNKLLQRTYSGQRLGGAEFCNFTELFFENKTWLSMTLKMCLLSLRTICSATSRKPFSCLIKILTICRFYRLSANLQLTILSSFLQTFIEILRYFCYSILKPMAILIIPFKLCLKVLLSRQKSIQKTTINQNAEL